MNTVIIVLAIVGLASATEVDISTYSLSSEAVKAIESIRDEMPCGFPELGIPPLAPLVLPQKEVDINNELLQMNGAINNFILNGLNDFEIHEFKINAITSKITFRFTFRNINVDTFYDLSLLAKKSGFTINMIGNGRAKFAIKDMSISGTVKYSFGVLTGKLKIKSMKIRTRIGEVESNIEGVLGKGDINTRMNNMLAEMVTLGINENEDQITETIEKMAMPRMNDALKEVNISDLIHGGNGEPKEKCNVQTN
ncbi:uncharacterized protein [Eurosta solidaginis]|uniref:uncharacterized protein n=1 Tax=Eurosta solidaginis TaxID=178769 RepID=UPI0035310EE8